MKKSWKIVIKVVDALVWLWDKIKPVILGSDKSDISSLK